MVIIVMGVSGSGKSTVGKLLAADLHWKFVEGDDFHPPENIDKMSRGIPLTDDDRRPWLAALRQIIEAAIRSGDSLVVSCSALKESYRQILSGGNGSVHFVYLKGSHDQLMQRLQSRTSHFMKPELLESQLAALEEPRHELTLDISLSPAELVSRIRSHFTL